ncbi:MAG: riboflavin biosynthesis protein RibD [Alteromonadaceae bacterium]|nr:riboflavin biosynthesis protein RibD [Alteromonadaceae bacterium]
MISSRADNDRVRDRGFMAEAIQLARRGLYSTDPNPRVGCLLVKDDRIVGRGWHRYAGEAHAEVDALAQAGSAARDATAYVTLEPCCHYGRTPPCSRALIEAGIARVVIATADANPQVAGQGIAQLQAAGIETSLGLLEAEAAALNAGFLRRMRGDRPFVRVKIAASVDGRTAMQSGESQWITAGPARADVQRLRARSSAIITGIGTLLEDNPSLTVRPSEMGDLDENASPRTQPCRVVLDSGLRTPPVAKMLQAEGRTVILCRQSNPSASEDAGKSERRTMLEAAGAEVTELPGRAGESGLTWPAIVEWLQTQPFNEVLIEAGATVAGSAITAGIVDELWLYQAPTLLGSRGRPLAELPFDHMAQQQRLTVLDRRQLGADTRTIFSLRASA